MNLAGRNVQGLSLARASYPLGGGVLPILRDLCEGAAATIVGRSPDIGTGTWDVDTSGTMSIWTDGAGMFENTSGSGVAYGKFDVGVGKGFYYDFNIRLASRTGVVFRYSNSLNHFICDFDTTRFYIRERTGGSATTRNSKAHVFTNSTIYTARIEVTDAGEITFTIDGDSISYTSTAKETDTVVAVSPFAGGTGHRWDNIEVGLL